MRKVLIGAAAVFVAALLFLFGTLPPAPVRVPLDHLDPAIRARTVRGAYHVHTSRSDGAGDKDAVATAAARAGLQFVILTEHGDGTRTPDPPAYLHGVLCLDGVEISTNGGHYVALGLPAAPYPLGGEASAVVEDVARLGGFGVVAHPDHPRPQLAWTDWDVPVDGIEWLNADAAWRDESGLALARIAFAYFVRPGPALASVFDRPSTTLDRWDALSKRRRVVALAAVDAHGGGRRRAVDEGAPRATPGPSYEASFRSISNRVFLVRPFNNDPRHDAALLLEAIRRGDVYSVVDAISPDVGLNMGARTVSWTSSSSLPSIPEAFEEDGRQRLEVIAEHGPGTPPVPWILTNWMGDYPAASIPVVSPLPDGGPLNLPSAWRVEHDPSSSGRVSGAGNLISLEYRLGGEGRRSQFVGAAADLAGSQAFEALAFRGRAGGPMRVSVQLRFRPDDRRWVKSVYLGPEDRDVTIRLAEMKAAEQPGAPMPTVGSARSILFVVDLVNAVPGASGGFTISDLRAVR